MALLGDAAAMLDRELAPLPVVAVGREVAGTGTVEADVVVVVVVNAEDDDWFCVDMTDAARVVLPIPMHLSRWGARRWVLMGR